MTSEQATQINTAMTSTVQTILSDFISILPTVGIVIGIAFVIGFVMYWLKRMRKVR